MLELTAQQMWERRPRPGLVSCSGLHLWNHFMISSKTFLEKSASCLI